MVSRKTKPNDTKKHSRISNSMRRGKMLDRRPDAETREREREREAGEEARRDENRLDVAVGRKRQGILAQSVGDTLLLVELIVT